MNKFKWILLAVFGAAVVMIILMVTGLLLGSYKGTANSNGERIYFTATNDRGQRITYTGGPAFGGMMMRGQLACASCHGVDGSGGQYFMHMQSLDAPDMRWAALSGPDSFRTMVVEGKRPNGEPLGSDMPRWNLNDEDLSDLADFITSMLDSEKGENKMFPGQFMMGGWWMIIPIIGLLFMVFFMFLMMNRAGFWSDRHESRRDRSESQDTESALDILKKRYAKGEITKEEFDQIREDL
jgi:uncharacterized membrane protein